MVKNSRLQEIVVTEINKIAQQDPEFASFCENEEELGKSIVKSMGEVQVDKAYKFRMMYSGIIGYGYDFQAPCDEGDPKEIYQRAVANTEKMSGKPHLEKFLSKGTIEDRFGWYITTFPDSQ